MPPGSLAEHRADIENFYGGVLGANVFNYEGAGNLLIVSFDEGFPSQSLVLNEAEDFMQAPGFDHIGLEYETYEEVDSIIAACRELEKRDDRIQIDELPDGKMAERLDKLDHDNHTIGYTLAYGNPIGLAEYSAVVRLEPADGGACRIIWHGEFSAADGHDPTTVAESLEGSYQGMSAALAAYAQQG